MSVLSPAEVVRLLFEARANGDLRRVMALLDPDVEAQTIAGGETFRGVAAIRKVFAREAATGCRVEVDAHRFEVAADGSVLVHGRVRVIDHGSLADSPATWRCTVRRGRVVAIEPLVAEKRLRQVA